MKNKKLWLVVACALLMLWAIWNWLGYLQGETPAVGGGDLAVTPSATEDAARAVPPAVRPGQKKASLPLDSEDAPKRAPLPGTALLDPFRETTAKQQSPASRKVHFPKIQAKKNHHLQMVLLDGARRRATIDGVLYAEGDSLGGMIVKDILPGKVILQSAGGVSHPLVFGNGLKVPVSP